VADAVGAVDRRVADRFFEVVELPGRAADLDLAIAANDRNSRGVITAIFEAAQTIQNERNDFFGADVTYDSTHGRISGNSARAADMKAREKRITHANCALRCEGRNVS
jgi:hypothetical protein